MEFITAPPPLPPTAAFRLQAQLVDESSQRVEDERKQEKQHRAAADRSSPSLTEHAHRQTKEAITGVVADESAKAQDKAQKAPDVSRLNKKAPRRSAFDKTMATKRPLTILIAEDNVYVLASRVVCMLILRFRVNQKMIASMLGKFGYQVDIVDNGRKAVDAVTERALQHTTLTTVVSSTTPNISLAAADSAEAKSPAVTAQPLSCYDLVRTFSLLFASSLSLFPPLYRFSWTCRSESVSVLHIACL